MAEPASAEAESDQDLAERVVESRMRWPRMR
ncbi:hypothetical protein J2X68_002227 [Streptomyces sp. 3330]|nr:hypothetical protein [Streptomyces sp. 3330]